jgi:protein N-terminal methyltransferase
VTQELLLHHFGTVDLLEPSKHLLDTAQEKLAAATSTFPAGHKPGKFFYQGLEKFEPEQNRYDCLWLQWCVLALCLSHCTTVAVSTVSQ